MTLSINTSHSWRLRAKVGLSAVVHMVEHARQLEIVDQRGSPIDEFDGVGKGFIVENKSAQGPNKLHLRKGGCLSVGLIITYSSSERPDRLLPIATEQVFQEYWQPLSKRLGLQWVPLFQSGLPIFAEDVAPIVQELKTIQQALSTADLQLPQHIIEYMHPRVEALITQLEQLPTEPVADVYIV